MFRTLLPLKDSIIAPAYFLILVGTLSLAVGCSGQKMREGFVDVRGTVTLDGEPLPDAQIIIETKNGTSFARTDENGGYIAEYSKTLKGAAVGSAVVRISTKEVFPDEDVSGLKIDPRSGDHIKPERVPPKYNTKSELKIEIEGDGGPYDFKLTPQ